MLKALTRVAVVGLAWTAAVAASAQTSSVPTVEGPIAVTAQTGDAYRGSNEQPVAGPGLPMPDLVRYDYIQDEYFLSGTVDGMPYKTSLQSSTGQPTAWSRRASSPPPTRRR